jgi:hypothetical protein
VDVREGCGLVRGRVWTVLAVSILLWIRRRWLRPTIATAWTRWVVWLRAIAAARLPVLGPWPTLRSGSVCPLMICGAVAVPSRPKTRSSAATVACN